MSKVQSFVKTRLGAGKPADNEGSSSQVVERQQESLNIDFSEANRKKKRHEAQSLKVTRSNITALSKDNLAAAPGSRQVQHEPTQDRELSIEARSVFGTDSQGADETTIFSLRGVATSRADPRRQAQDLSDDGEDDHESEGYASIFEHANAQGTGMAFETQQLLETVGPQVFGLDQLSFVGSLRNDLSYPPTTTGDFEDEDTVSHDLLQTSDVPVDVVEHNHSSQLRPSSQSTPQANQDPPHVRSVHPSASNTKDSTPSRGAHRSAPAEKRFAIRSADDRFVTQSSVAQARSVPQAPQQKPQTAVPPDRSQHQTLNFPYGRNQAQNPQPAPVNTAHGDDDGQCSDGSGESDQASLDYPIEDLVKMSYEELRKEPQDDDPQAKPLTLPDSVSAGDLAAKLQHVKNLQPDQQVQFCAGLKLGEWEEAGDWILEQFGAVLKGFREVRTEKRRLAAEVEDNIYSRHQRIENRKRKVDEALAEMKASGVAVLDKTPRKKKK